MVVYVCDNLHPRLRRLRMHIISIIDLPAGRPKYLALCMAYCFMRPESRIILKMSVLLRRKVSRYISNGKINDIVLLLSPFCDKVMLSVWPVYSPPGMRPYVPRFITL